MPAGPSLARFLVLYEPEDACRGRLLAAGYSAEVAAEIAFYLAQASDFAALLPAVRAAFAEHGIEVLAFPLDAHAAYLPLLRGPERERTLLWCLTDGFAWYRGSFATSLAALLDVPQFGSPPAVQHMCQDKFRCVALAQALGVRTPATVLVEDGRPLSPVGALPCGEPLFVKPNTLGGKLGIEGDSRTDGLEAALGLTRRIHARYGDRSLIQGFVPGRDVRVSFLDLGDPAEPLGLYVIGTGSARGFPTLADSLQMTTLRAAGTAEGLTVIVQDLRREPAAAAQVERLEAAVRRMAEALGLRDYYSFDFRLGEDGEAYFLELEVCPAVTIYDFLTYLRDRHGLELPQALARAAPLAWARRALRQR